jgi:hypothetical protein
MKTAGHKAGGVLLVRRLHLRSAAIERAEHETFNGSAGLEFRRNWTCKNVKTQSRHVR